MFHGCPRLNVCEAQQNHTLVGQSKLNVHICLVTTITIFVLPSQCLQVKQTPSYQQLGTAAVQPQTLQGQGGTEVNNHESLQEEIGKNLVMA